MEKRTIELDINQAKEMYQMGGVYKTLALCAFTEEELNPKVFYNTWEDFFKNVMLDQRVFYIDSQASIKTINVSNPENYNLYRNSCTSADIARAHRAMMQLHMLRDYYNNGWNPEMDTQSDTFIIQNVKGDLKITRYSAYARNVNRFLIFKDKEIAYQFLENFKDLILKAQMLI